MPMPGVDWDDPAFWDQMYEAGAEPWGHVNTRDEVRVHYHRCVQIQQARWIASHVVPLLGWTAASRVACLGCGFGWLMEALEELGITQTIGVDLSSYIQGRKALPEDDDLKTYISAVGLNPLTGEGLTLLNTLRGDGTRAKKAALVTTHDISGATGRKAIRDFLGGGGFDIFTEDLVTSLTDAECVQYSGYAHTGNFGANRVIHLVTPAQPGNWGPFNWKTLAQWKALLPNDYFISVNTFEMV